MSTRTIQLDDSLYAYLLEASLREPDVLADLRSETAKLPDGHMQISPEQGQFMKLLCFAVGARRAIEIGTFTGYSSICIASALSPGGKLIACDVSRERTDIARTYWQRAGVANRVELRLAPALDTLDALIADGQAGQFDFAFVDADKDNYPTYYERCLTLLRAGGLLAVDNALWSGRVADASNHEPATETIRCLNETARDDERVVASLVPIGDGLLLACKR